MPKMNFANVFIGANPLGKLTVSSCHGYEIGHDQVRDLKSASCSQLLSFLTQAEGKSNRQCCGPPCSPPCALLTCTLRCWRPVILPHFPFPLSSVPQRLSLSHWSKFATSGFKEWLHIPATITSRTLGKGTWLAAAGCILPWLMKELPYSLKLVVVCVSVAPASGLVWGSSTLTQGTVDRQT